jgi:predicted Zn-dependent peptidase
MIKSVRAAALSALFLLAASPQYALISDPGQYLTKNVVARKLPNGISVVLLNRGYAPVLAMEISFRVGSVDESYRTMGAAHLLEHMLFKGTDKIGTRNYKKERPIIRRLEALGETVDRLKLADPGNTRIPELEAEMKRLMSEERRYVDSSPYDRIYTENGAIGFNASTSKDMTSYYVELPANKLEMWAKMESERLMNPVLREYYLERNNVLEERLMRYDSIGSGLLFERFIATAFIAHPYRHPIIGWRSNIPYLSIADVRRFYHDYYIPSRMTITVVGMQDTDKSYEMIRRYFSRIEPRREPEPVTVKEPRQSGERRFTLVFESEPYLIIGWHKHAFPSRDDYVCEVIADILAGGKSSRLYRSLVMDKKIASSVSAWNGVPGSRFDNLFVIFATPAPSHSTRELEQAIYDQMEGLFNTVQEREISKVINGIESGMVFDLETNNGIARMLNEYQTLFGDWRYAVDYISAIKGIRPGDIRAMKDKYFTAQNRTVGVLVQSRVKEGTHRR